MTQLTFAEAEAEAEYAIKKRKTRCEIFFEKISTFNHYPFAYT